MFLCRRCLAAGLLLLASCAAPPARQEVWDGPAAEAPVRLEGWKYPLGGARVLVTPHYRLHSDLTSAPDLAAAGQLLEGAYLQYRALAGDVPASPPPLSGYLFSGRDPWTAFTRANTGEDALVYLQVTRGAYTVSDWFAAYWLGDRATWAVLGHEGWHQFVARHFVGRLPPALEEGLACLFENVQWQGQLPRWNVAANPPRERALEMARQRHLLLPLDKLVRLHAGELVGQPPERVQAFYAQTWALVRYLMEGEEGRYRLGLERLLADTAAGRAWLPPHLVRPRPGAWNAELVAPTLEHYLGVPLTEVERGFNRFIER